MVAYTSSSHRLTWIIGLCFVLKVMCEEAPEECKAALSNGKEPCCNMPDITTEEEEKQYNHCFEQLTNQNASTTLMTQFNETLEECVEECFFNSLGVLNPDKTLNPEKIKKEMSGRVEKSDVWTAVIESAVAKCLDLAPKMLRSDSKCGSGAFQFDVCVFEEMYMNCPATKWTSSDQCKDEKAVMKKCAKFVYALNDI